MAPSNSAPEPLRTAGSSPADRVLFDLLAPDLNSRWLARTARTFGWVLTAYSSIPFLFIGAKSPAFAQFTIWQNLATLSWLSGFACFAVAAPTTNLVSADLVRLRGVSLAVLSRVEWAAAISVPFKVMAPACLVMSTLSTLRSPELADGSRRILTILGAGCYALLATGVLGFVALWARRLSPNRGRLLFLLVVVVPLLLEQALPITSIPSVLSQMLTLCLSLGANL